MKKRNLAIAVAAMMIVAPIGLGANAQSTRAAAYIGVGTQNFTPVQKAACGPRWGRWCGPFHRRVCGRWRCWCAPC